MSTQELVEYSPSEEEEYMCERQLAWFRARLMEQREEWLTEARNRLEALKEHDGANSPDMVDRSAYEVWRDRELQAQDRFRQLLEQNRRALQRIDDGAYGICEETGEEIGIRRLMALPHTALCLEAQQALERRL